VVGDSSGRCFCRRALITLVMPLHWPGSANAADSVCLYREQKRAPIRCRAIVRPRPTAGLGSPVLGIWGPAGNHPLHAPASDPTLIMPVIDTYSGKIESLDRDPGIATLDPGNVISRELTSLMDRQTDRRTSNSFIDQAVSKTDCSRQTETVCT